MVYEAVYKAIDERTLDQPLPPYSTAWENDSQEAKEPGQHAPSNGSYFLSLRNRVPTPIRSSTRTILRFFRTKLWPAFRVRRQLCAFLLLFLCGIVPFVLVGHLDKYSGWYEPFFSKLSEPKFIGCGDRMDPTIITGAEALFVLDQKFGRFPFSLAKTIDVAWDMAVGRGAQLLAWWISYNVFTDALLRLIERHPATYGTFICIAIEGPCLASSWTLLKELFRKQSKRTWALFFYMVLATLYVVSIPTLLSAMTGYDSTSILWANLEGNNMVPLSEFSIDGFLVYGTANSTLASPVCVDSDEFSNDVYLAYRRRADCDCKAPNGTVVEWTQWANDLLYDHSNQTLEDCIFNYPGNTQTYSITHGWAQTETFNCNRTFPYTIDGVTYDVATLNLTMSDGYMCYGGKPYDYSHVEGTTRCLPDTVNQTYQWGFSSTLSAIFVIVNFVWSVTMYFIWQDAQFFSHLVISGFRMSQLRAAFALTDAAKEKTGFEARDLITVEKRLLHKELFGSRKSLPAEVNRSLFMKSTKTQWEEEGEGLRQRRGTREESGYREA